MRSNSGFVTVALIAFLPLLLAVGGGLTALAFVLYANRILEHTCMEEMIQAQARVAQAINLLLAMNEEAHELYLELAVATAAMPPPARALMNLRIQNLTSRQLAALANVEQAAATSCRAAPQKLSSALREHHFQSAALQTNQPSSGVLAPVRAVRIHPQLSVYKAVPNLESLQTQTVSWTVYPDRLLHPFLPSSFLGRNLKIPGTCAGTIYEKGETWHPTLAPAKFLSNY